MSEEIPETVYATESNVIDGRVSQRATSYHTDEGCRQLSGSVDIDGSVAAQRGLKPCTYCAGGGFNPGTYNKNYAWDIKGMDDDERQALADNITTND